MFNLAMDKIESIRRAEGSVRRTSAMGRRQSLTTTNVQQFQEKQKEKAAKYKGNQRLLNNYLISIHHQKF
jgi:hypothetical protein